MRETGPTMGLEEVPRKENGDAGALTAWREFTGKLLQQPHLVPVKISKTDAQKGVQTDEPGLSYRRASEMPKQ